MGSSVALVTPWSWTFATNYQEFREAILTSKKFLSLAKLGTGAFETITGEVVSVGLAVIARHSPSRNTNFFGIDAFEETTPSAKANFLAARHGASISHDVDPKN